MKHPRVRTKPREQRLALLTAWVRWAADRESTVQALNRRLGELVRDTTGANAGFLVPNEAQIRWLQGQANAAFAFLASAKPGQELELERPPNDRAPAFFITKGHGALASYDGSTAAIGSIALRLILTHPELQRINRCIVPGCHAPLVEKKRALYCPAHGSAASRSRRHYEKCSVEERQQRRRRLYIESLRIRRPEYLARLCRVADAIAAAVRVCPPVASQTGNCSRSNATQ